MNDTTLLGPWVRRFLLEHLIGERNLSRQTQLSYRDTLRLLLPFVADQCHRPLDQLTVEQVSAAHVHGFLHQVEEVRQCTTTTRNQRLAAIRALASFVAVHSPEHIAWCGELRRIPFKNATQALVPYLEKPEMDALLNAPDRSTKQGRRDYALLLFLYNSGARASEAAQLNHRRHRPGSSGGKVAGQRQQEPPLPALAHHHPNAHATGGATGTDPAGFS